MQGSRDRWATSFLRANRGLGVAGSQGDTAESADLTGQYRFRLGREGGGVDAGGACPSVDCMVGA